MELGPTPVTMSMCIDDSRAVRMRPLLPTRCRPTAVGDAGSLTRLHGSSSLARTSDLIVLDVLEEDLCTVLMERHALLAWLEMQVGQLQISDARAVYLEKLLTALGGHLRSGEHGTNKGLRSILADGLPEHVLETYSAVASRLAQVLVACEESPAVART